MNNLSPLSMYQEYNFDGLVGPTHNYAGLSHGNLASMRNKQLPSNPRAAALQGLEKAITLADLGIPQAILPPLERPHIAMLRSLGFDQKDERAVLAKAARAAPDLLVAACSASAMWTANAATVAPSADTPDGLLHITAANLSSKLHRAFEAPQTHAMLERIFADKTHFAVHPPLSGGSAVRDEGAANHTRLCTDFGQSGLHLFVYGVDESNPQAPTPKRFTARQTMLASNCVARINQLDPRQCLFVQQNPDAIDAGVFHNDVIAVGHRNLLLYHQQAFANETAAISAIRDTFHSLTGSHLHLLRVSNNQLSMAEAVQTYLFNSQLIQLPDATMAIVVPAECEHSETVRALLQSWVEDSANPISRFLSFDLRESMQNGGGPACLRQRIVLSHAERDAISANIFLNATLYQQLRLWVQTHYRDCLHESDLADPDLLDESRTALDALTQILNLGSVYDFQK